MEPIAHVLARVLRQSGLERNVRGWQAVGDWPEAVGPRVARHAHAVGFRDGILRVEVEGSAWMHEMGFLKRDLIRNLNRRLGGELVRDIRFAIARGGTQR
jgi:predicted nucleic acid-binding Zn ribbon protein